VDGVLKNIIKAVNQTLFTTNLMKVGNAKEMPNLNAPSKGWQEKVGNQGDAITKLTTTDWESYWQYMVKPHS